MQSYQFLWMKWKMLPYTGMAKNKIYFFITWVRGNRLQLSISCFEDHLTLFKMSYKAMHRYDPIKFYRSKLEDRSYQKEGIFSEHHSLGVWQLIPMLYSLFWRPFNALWNKVLNVMQIWFCRTLNWRFWSTCEHISQNGRNNFYV